jgi:hypothetical protein
MYQVALKRKKEKKGRNGEDGGGDGMSVELHNTISVKSKVF